MFIDLSGILSIYILTIYNRNIRKLYAKSVIILTQRYQLAENTKVLKSILPILKIGLFNVYIMIANFLWVVNNSSYRVYIKQWMDKFFPENKEPSQSQNQEIKIINVEGKIIPSKSTVDSHHNMMKKVWS
uniref:Uncharacterized protein n=1 Tax=Acrobeloides nanus TaxID=290746 RepID=A0A914DP84_9BILA